MAKSRKHAPRMGTHSSRITKGSGADQRALTRVGAIPGVKKLIVGKSKAWGIRAGTGIRLVGPTPTGFALRVPGSSGMTDVFIVVEADADREAVEAAIREALA